MTRLVAFVGTYGPPEEPGIHVFEVDSSNGRLLRLGEARGIRNASYLVLHPSGRFLYAVSEIGRQSDGSSGEVHALRVHNGKSGVELSPINHRSTKGDNPCHLSIDRTGRWLSVVNYGTGDVVLYPIEHDGRLGTEVARMQHSGHGLRPQRQEGPHPHSSVFSPDNLFLIVADLGADRLVVYAFDEESGSVRSHGDHETVPGAGPRHLAFHPDGRFLFVVNELDNTMTVWRRCAKHGVLECVQSLVTVRGGAAANSLAADIRVSHSGRRVYASTRGDDMVTRYAFDASGRLELLDSVATRGHWPRSFDVSPDGDLLLVANERADEVVLVSSKEPDSEIVGRIASARVLQPSCVVFG